MSLRARLIACLVAVAAVGLLLLAGITYAEQRSFLLERAEEQAKSALPAVYRDLVEENAGFPGRRDRGGLRPGFRGGFGPGGFGRRGDGGGRGRPGAPPGTYAEVRDPTGARVGEPAELNFAGESSLSPPRLPGQLSAGQSLTVSSRDGSFRYRVVVEPRPGLSGTTVVAVPLRDVDQTLDRLLLVEGLVIAGVLGLLAVLAFFVVRVGLRPLDRIGETAGAIAAGDLSRRVSPATPRTEIGRLGLALNAMLERLEQAFAQREASESRLRRFLADASHELRTPLASIRGYAELFRMGAARTPEELAKAMRRIEDEAARMGVLVEDLLALARLEEVRDAAREPVDLADLADDAVHDARATAPDHKLTLTARDSAIVWGDPHQLRQVLANLLRNALVHTPDATPVEVFVARDDATVRAEVRDHGPGLPEGDPAALFERFGRAGGAGRERGPGGAGLGLAIVAGIVAAHGGRVSACDAPGGGARFVVELPAHVEGPAAGAPAPQPA